MGSHWKNLGEKKKVEWSDFIEDEMEELKFFKQRVSAAGYILELRVAF